MIIIIAHATLVDGKIYEPPANTLVETLKNQKKDFLYLRHSIDGKLKSIVYVYKLGKQVDQRAVFVIPRPAPLRYITEIIGSIWYFIFNPKTWSSCYIGLDPLNAFTGVILKKLHVFKKVIFYTADYSKRRFSNRLLNKIYLAIDAFCVANADEVWNVSSRICGVREKMGLDPKKNIFVPNTPSDSYKKYTSNTKNKYQLISLGIVSEQLDYIGVFEAIKELKEDYPKLTLKIVGDGPKKAEYKKYVVENKLEQHVFFLGYLNHDQALEEISKSGIGLALYNGKWDFNKYGDSMKCREYFCYGLPVLTTDTHSTVDEIKISGAGIVCTPNKDAYKNSLRTIYGDYDNFSMKSKELSLKYAEVHSKLLNDLLC